MPMLVDIGCKNFHIYYLERDLIGLSGDRVCLFTAEADVEEEVKISDKIIRAMGRIHIHSDILVSYVK